MAAEAKLTSSVKRSSDNVFEFSCSPCSDDDKDAEAVNYCVNCQSYFCETCLRHHNRFKAMKEHKILDKTEMKSGTSGNVLTQQPATMDNSYCSDHPGNTINMYCAEHDVVCCTVCVAVDHRGCNGVDPLSKVAKGVMESSDKEKTETALKKVRIELENLKAKIVKELSSLDCTLEHILKEIESLKKRILDKVNELERESVEEIRAKHEEIACKLKTDIATVDAMLTTTDTQIGNMNKVSHDNKSTMFVQMKTGQKLDASYKRYIEKVKHLHADTIAYEMNTTIEKVLKDSQSLVSLDVGNHSYKYTATLDAKVNVKVNGDMATCSVYDVCQLEGGGYIITDYSNDKLKELDRKFNVTGLCTIPGGPVGICKTKTNELAVTLWNIKKVQFVSVNQEMSLTRSFDVDVQCKGIQYNQNRLYISCKNEGIRVYDLLGNILGKYENDQDGRKLFTNPGLMKISSDGSVLRVATGDSGLVTLNKQGQKELETSDKILESAFGLCEGPHGEIFVSSFQLDNVVQLDKRGTVLQKLLSKCDGISSPHAVAYIPNPKRILVTFKASDEIKVFKLS